MSRSIAPRGVASLGMYDHPAQQAANDRLWSAIAARLSAAGLAGVPDRLDRTRDVQAIWRDPDLVLGQACGYPLSVDARLNLRIVALPVYDVEGSIGATHRSVIVARAEDPRAGLAAFRGARAAINDPGSNTGMNLFRAAIAHVAGGDARFFADVVTTGAHRASVAAVGEGLADIAAIDGVSYAAIARFEPALTASLRIVAHSPFSPTLPFVTAARTDDATLAALRGALAEAMADPALDAVRDTLFLRGLAAADAATLDPIVALAAEAARAGYADLR